MITGTNSIWHDQARKFDLQVKYPLYYFHETGTGYIDHFIRTSFFLFVIKIVTVLLFFAKYEHFRVNIRQPMYLECYVCQIWVHVLFMSKSLQKMHMVYMADVHVMMCSCLVLMVTNKGYGIQTGLI